MAALVKDYALGLQHQALELRLLNDDAARGDSPARVDDAMPGNVALVLGRSVHGPADESRAVAVFEQAGYLAVGHHAASRYAQHHAVDLFKHLLVSGGRPVLFRLIGFSTHYRLALPVYVRRLYARKAIISE